ncbi:MAG: hypothetical protein WBL63_17070, partial [Candidatus Acidiferrum sp.]
TLPVLILLAFVPLGVSATNPARLPVTKIVSQIQRADYEGDRAALKGFYAELLPFVNDKEMASRVRYWRGFALWRRVINGFNEGINWKEQEEDLLLALDEFNIASTLDPEFVDAKVGAGSCLTNLLYLNLKNPDRFKELVGQFVPLFKTAQAAAPDNPRLLWVLGASRWSTPTEFGGGQEAALATYQKGLEAMQKQKRVTSDPLEPSWGEPELLMNLAWSNLNRTTPDLNAAEEYARSALALVPYWHYVRDILLPQIRDAKLRHN